MKTLLLRLPINLDNRYDYEDLMQPYGLACISSMLKNNGCNTVLFDAQAHRLLRHEIIAFIRKNRPDLIGFTAYTSNLLDIVSLLPQIKQDLPLAKIVLGGAHVTVEPELTLKEFPLIDFVVIGEGEITCFELVRALKNRGDLRSINGLAFRDDDEIIINKKREYIENLDDMPIADWASLPMEKYFGHHTIKRNYVKLLLSRGCPFQCTFCAVQNTMGNRLRKRSPSNIRNELELLYDRFNVRDFGFGDSTFNIDNEWVTEVCKEILNMNYPIIWRCNVRAKGLTKDILKIMKKSGCVHVTMGIESGDPSMLESMKKNETLDDFRQAIHMIKEIGLPLLNSFIIGMPGETPESIENTLRFAKEIKTYAGFNLATPFPGTEFYEQALQDGTVNSNPATHNPYDMSYVPETMSRYQLKMAYRQLTKDYYLRPTQLLRYLMGIKTFLSLSIHLHAFIRLIKKRRRMKAKAFPE